MSRPCIMVERCTSSVSHFCFIFSRWGRHGLWSRFKNLEGVFSLHVSQRAFSQESFGMSPVNGVVEEQQTSSMKDVSGVVTVEEDCLRCPANSSNGFPRPNSTMNLDVQPRQRDPPGVHPANGRNSIEMQRNSQGIEKSESAAPVSCGARDFASNAAENKLERARGGDDAAKSRHVPVLNGDSSGKALESFGDSAADAITEKFDKQRKSSAQPGASAGAGLGRRKTVDANLAGEFQETLTSRTFVQTLRRQTNVSLALEFFKRAGQQPGYQHSFAVYCALIELLSGARKFDALRRLQADVETKPETSGPLLATFASAYSRAGMMDDALACVERMDRLGCRAGRSVYNKLLHDVVKCGHPDEAYRMYGHMSAIAGRPDACTFNILLNGFGKAGRLETMETLIQEMRENSCAPTEVTLGILVDILCKAGRVDEAQSVVKANKDAANVVVYNALLHGLGKAGRIEQALQLFNEMSSSTVFVPEVTTWNIIIQTLGVANRIPEAVNLFGAMASRGLAPDLFTCNSMLKILIRARMVNEASELFESMPARGCRPDPVTYSTLIYELGKAGDIQTARTLFRRMQNAGWKPTAGAYGAFMSALCRGGRLNECLALFEEMKASGCVPDESVCTTVCGILFRAGRVDEARRLFETIERKGRTTYLVAFNTVIHALGKRREVHEMRSLFQDLMRTDCKPDVVTYNTLMGHLGKLRDVDAAYEVFLDMQRSGCNPDVVSYSTIVDVLCKHGRAAQALDLLGDMRQKGLFPNVFTYGSLIAGLCRAGQSERAYSLYREMVKEGCPLNEIACRSLIQSFSRIGKYADECHGLFKAMIEKGYASNVQTSFLLERSLTKAGKLDEAAFVRSRPHRKRKTPRFGG